MAPILACILTIPTIPTSTVMSLPTADISSSLKDTVSLPHGTTALRYYCLTVLLPHGATALRYCTNAKDKRSCRLDIRKYSQRVCQLDPGLKSFGRSVPPSPKGSLFLCAMEFITNSINMLMLC